MQWVARIVFTAAVLAVVGWLLRDGLPFGAVVVVLAAVWARRAVESGRALRLVRR